MCEHQKKFQDIILLDWSEPWLPGSDGAQARAAGNVAGSRDYKLSDIIWIQPDKMKAKMKNVLSFNCFFTIEDIILSTQVSLYLQFLISVLV